MFSIFLHSLSHETFIMKFRKATDSYSREHDSESSNYQSSTPSPLNTPAPSTSNSMKIKNSSASQRLKSPLKNEKSLVRSLSSPSTSSHSSSQKTKSLLDMIKSLDKSEPKEPLKKKQPNERVTKQVSKPKQNVYINSESIYSPSESESNLASSNSDSEVVIKRKPFHHTKHYPIKKSKREDENINSKKPIHTSSSQTSKKSRFTKEEDLALISYFQEVCKRHVRMDEMKSLSILKGRPSSSLCGRKDHLIKRWADLV